MEGNYSSLTTLAAEVERIEASKLDLLVPSGKLVMAEDNNFVISNEAYKINEYAHGQVASKLNIPKAYYDRMGKVPGLRTINVNEWLRKDSEKGEVNYVRTIDGKARAFLSNAYRTIDNYDVLASFLPVVNEMPVKIESASLTDKKMYLQLTFPQIEGEVKKGDVVRQGIILTNSEVGAGAVDIKHLIWRLVCSNGLISQSVMRKYHIGSRINENNADIFAADTVRAELDSFKLRMRDVLKHVTSRAFFDTALDKLKDADSDRIIKVTDTVANVTKMFGIGERFNDAIIENMAREGNFSRYGLANGITFLAHSIEDRDRQYEIEKIGSQIIEMSKNEFGKYQAA